MALTRTQPRSAQRSCAIDFSCLFTSWHVRLNTPKHNKLKVILGTKERMAHFVRIPLFWQEMNGSYFFIDMAGCLMEGHASLLQLDHVLCSRNVSAHSAASLGYRSMEHAQVCSQHNKVRAMALTSLTPDAWKTCSIPGNALDSDDAWNHAPDSQLWHRLPP